MWNFFSSLAWIGFLTFLFGFRYQEQIKSILNKLYEIKIDKSSIFLKLIDNKKVTVEENEELARAQVLRRMGDERNGYILYSNGLLRQTITLVIKQFETKVSIVFPVAFPNEITGFNIFSERSVKITSLRNSGCDILTDVDPSKDSEIKIIVFGILY